MEQDRLVLYAALALAFAVGVFVFWGPSNLKRKRGKGHVGGLLNLGHSCFLNTLLQAFGSCPHIISWLGQQLPGEEGGVIGALRFTLQVINGEHPEIRDDPFAPCDILSSLRARWNISPGEQDAHELFVVLVSALEDETQRAALPRACSLSDALELPASLLAPHGRLNSGTTSQNSGVSHNSGTSSPNACAGVNSGTASVNSEFASVNSDTADNASHSACAGQNSDAVSQNSGIASQNSGIASQNSVTVSQNSGIASQNSDIASQNSGIASQNSVTVSQNSGIASQNSGIASQNCATVSRNSGIASQNSGIVSRNSGIASQNGRPALVREVQSEWTNVPPPLSPREVRSSDWLLRMGVYRASTNRTHASLVRNPSMAGLPREIASPFQGLLTSSLHCTECGFKNVVQCDKFDSLSLPLPSGSLGRHSLSDLLDHFVATETVCVRCDSCKRPAVDFLKTLNFAKLPGCLCIHIVRTTWLSDGRASKRMDQVEYPELLLMDKYTYTQKEGDVKGRRHCYQLKAVIVHRGDLNSGHFVTYRRSKHSWVLTSDAEVLECTYAEAMSASAYMLFYDKC